MGFGLPLTQSSEFSLVSTNDIHPSELIVTVVGTLLIPLPLAMLA